MVHCDFHGRVSSQKESILATKTGARPTWCHQFGGTDAPAGQVRSTGFLYSPINGGAFGNSVHWRFEQAGTSAPGYAHSPPSGLLFQSGTAVFDDTLRIWSRLRGGGCVIDQGDAAPVTHLAFPRFQEAPRTRATPFQRGIAWCEMALRAGDGQRRWLFRVSGDRDPGFW
jgi:hypothetical protein